MICNFMIFSESVGSGARCCESTKNEHRTFATGVIPGRHDDRDESEDLP